MDPRFLAKHNLESKENSDAKLAGDQALPIRFAPPLQQLILESVDVDIDVKSEAKPYPYQGLKLFNEEQDVIALLWNRLQLLVKELAKDQKKVEEYKNKQAHLRILAIKYPHLLQDNKPLVGELFPDLQEFNPAALADYYVLRGGEPEELKILIQNHPELLNPAGEARDLVGRRVKGTLYQKALGASDFEMAEMLKTFLAPDEADRQYDEQFPEGWETAALEKLAENIKALDAVWQALKEAKTENEDTKENLAALKIECKPSVDSFKNYLQSEKVITVGYYFDLDFLIKANVYIEQKKYEIGGTNTAKEYLFWEQIFSSLQLRVSARDMQVFLHSICWFNENNPVTRALKFKNGGSPYSVSSSGLKVGMNCSITVWGEAAVGGYTRHGGWSIATLTKLILSKKRHAEKFKPQQKDKQTTKLSR